jgi:hypothetical protein
VILQIEGKWKMKYSKLMAIRLKPIEYEALEQLRKKRGDEYISETVRAILDMYISLMKKTETV